MSNLVSPKVYLIAKPTIHQAGLMQFLSDTGNEEFMDALTGTDAMDLCSFFAKLCYKSLTLGKNANISRIRDIRDNFISIIETGHHSVLEHAQFSFVAENVSRIEHTEQIRHRSGQSVSASSGRYVYDKNVTYWEPSCFKEFPQLSEAMREVTDFTEMKMNECYQEIIENQSLPFSKKKEITSAIRRMKPLGAAETLGFSANLRAIRHMINMRTSEHAEEEIRLVFNQVAEIMKKEIPLLFCDCEELEKNGLTEYRFGTKH